MRATAAPASSMQLLRARLLLRSVPSATRAVTRPPPVAVLPLPRGAQPRSTASQAAGPSAGPVLDGRYDYADVAVPRATEVTDGVWREADARLVEAAALDGEAGRTSPLGAAAPAGEPEPLALLGMRESELVALAVADGQPAFRGKQLYDALYGKSNTPLTLDDVSTLPAAWRASLKARGVTLGRSTVHAVAAAKDGTTKLLLRLGDGRVVEAVGIPSDEASKPRLTVCVSSQVGCPMRCTFCATGKGGFARNLRPHEIVDQVLQIEAHFGKRASHVVFMGMGEPLLNLRGVLAAQYCLSADVGIGSRKLTISTVGVPNTLARLAASELQVTLAVSLHAPNQALREQLIPSAKVYDMDALLEDCLAYTQRTKRRVTFEYTLLRGVNDQPEHASELARVLKRFGLASHVNLIPFNPVDGAQYARPAAGAAQAFASALRAGGCGASVRQTRGLDAAAACGMLRNAFQSKAGPLAPVPLLPTK